MSSEEQGQLRPVADPCQPTPQPSQSKIPFLRVQPGKAPLLVSTLQQSMDGYSGTLSKHWHWWCRLMTCALQCGQARQQRTRCVWTILGTSSFPWMRRASSSRTACCRRLLLWCLLKTAVPQKMHQTMNEICSIDCINILFTKICKSSCT